MFYAMENVISENLLGVIVDTHLPWKPHIDKLAKTISPKIVLQRRIKKYVPHETNHLLQISHSVTFRLLQHNMRPVPKYIHNTHSQKNSLVINHGCSQAHPFGPTILEMCCDAYSKLCKSQICNTCIQMSKWPCT